MLAFVSRRLLATIPVLVMVAVVFAILRSSQGDPAVIMAGDGARPSVSNRYARSWAWTSRW